MEESHMYYAEWKNPESSDYIQYTSIYMISWGWQNYRDRSINDCYGLKVWERVNYKGSWGNCLGWWNSSISWFWGWFHDFVHFSNLIELYTNKGWIWLYINYTSMKMVIWRKSIHRHCLSWLSWQPSSNQAGLFIFSANCFEPYLHSAMLLPPKPTAACLPTHHSSQIVLATVASDLIFAQALG